MGKVECFLLCARVDIRYIMSPNSGGRGGWSGCSLAQLAWFVASGYAHCLQDRPRYTGTSLPGNGYNRWALIKAKMIL